MKGQVGLAGIARRTGAPRCNSLIFRSSENCSSDQTRDVDYIILVL